MRSLILDLWPLLCRTALLATMLAVALACVFLNLPGPPDVVLLLAVGASLAGILLPYAWQHRWAWAFTRQTRHFRTTAGTRVVLRHPADLPDPAGLLALAEKTLTDLEGTFGRLTLYWHGRTIGPLLCRSRVHVYVFPGEPAIQEVFGPRYGAIALTGLHAVVFPQDGMLPDEWLRHEMTHLFADRINPAVPPLFKEGLATCMQATVAGCPIDDFAAVILGEQDLRLRRLLEPRFFFGVKEDAWSWYVLAGSFSGYLIRRFGWEAYRKFYARLWNHLGLDGRFRKDFGLTLDDAEEAWRAELALRLPGAAPRG
jgi:hypothetical protein